MNQLLQNINFLSDQLTDLHFYFTNVPNIAYCKYAEELINCGHELVNILYKYGDSFKESSVDTSISTVTNILSLLEMHIEIIENEHIYSLTDAQKIDSLTTLTQRVKIIIQNIVSSESLDIDEI